MVPEHTGDRGSARWRRAFDALELEAEPLLVHGAALLQLRELLLILQVVLLVGCAAARRRARAQQPQGTQDARRGLGRKGEGAEQQGAPRSLSVRSNFCC